MAAALNRTDESSGPDLLELISFEIGGQELCIDIRMVREIRGWSAATHMPQTPDYVLGVINLRGAVMPVLDLGQRLGLGPTEPSSRHVIVVVQNEDRLFGLLVDAVQETFTVDSALVQAPPPMDRQGSDLFVDGILSLDGRMLSRLVVSALMPADTPLAA